jgi:hypothetical protein
MVQRRLSVIGIALGVIVALAPFQEARQIGQPPPKPVEAHPIRGALHPAAPPTLREAYAKADLVIDGVVTEAVPADLLLRTTPRLEAVFTAYSLLIIEMYKSDAATTGAGTVRVIREGGIRDRGDHLERQEDPTFPLFEVGNRYIMFLVILPGRDGEYAPMIGPDSAYRLDQQTLHTQGRSALAKAIGGGGYGALRRALLAEKGPGPWSSRSSFRTRTPRGASSAT